MLTVLFGGLSGQLLCSSVGEPLSSIQLVLYRQLHDRARDGTSKMTIHQQSIIVMDAESDDGRNAKDMLDALQDFARSRATRRLFKDCDAAGIKAEMMIPLLKNPLLVDPRALAKAVRQVMRAVLDDGVRSDLYRIELFPAEGGKHVNIVARPTDGAGEAATS